MRNRERKRQTERDTERQTDREIERETNEKICKFSDVSPPGKKKTLEIRLG